jgi:histidyl-tRNA synthetase
MSKALQPVRGTHDILPEEARKRRYISDLARQVLQSYCYEEIHTPIFEFSDVFHRTLGESSDVVSKETYSFEDRGGESLTLRPELTAAIARAFISNGLQQDLPCLFFSEGPAFRYERPQKGRQRQFHQLSVESLGLAGPQADIDMIALGWSILKKLGLQDRVTLQLNSLGDSTTRQTYRDQLVAYFTEHQSDLSEDSRIRLEKNPLRILDSKDEGDRAIIAHAPAFSDCFTEEAASFFTQVREGLDAINIPYQLNERLVRGLDYYSHTVFEFTCEGLGAQDTILAGGRYDGLIELMGGPATPAIGFGMGIERLLLAVDWEAEAHQTAEPLKIALIPLGEQAEKHAPALAHRLREAQLATLPFTRGNMSKQLKKATKKHATHALIFGEDELTANHYTVKDLTGGTQENVSAEGLVGYFTELLK